MIIVYHLYRFCSDFYIFSNKSSKGFLKSQKGSPEFQKLQASKSTIEMSPKNNHIGNKEDDLDEEMYISKSTNPDHHVIEVSIDNNRNKKDITVKQDNSLKPIDHNY